MRSLAAPMARRMSGYEAMIEEVRFAEDSPLEEGVSCELVSGNPNLF